MSVDKEEHKQVVDVVESPQQFLLFGKYSYTDVVIPEEGMKRYINIAPMFVIDTAGIYANRPFGKVNVPIVERLINILMKSGKYTGKKSKAYNTVRKAFDIIHERTHANPLQVLVNAISMSSPREEITRLQYGGISVPKAVDSSVYRRISVSLRNIVKGAIEAPKNRTTDISKALANEIVLASKGDVNSYAVSKKAEIERIASSAR
ncbi:MAG: 30S ribosomal protein S7 [Candidatus Thermoplasmatota archaeon]|jgi:small subunit ribosomal protein S7|nr:30S ribosomal protein S7 [Candidatus Thermoplasmatota archaeon]MCL5963542.1 30S ribosomal protein S7 [Candidatus Thermoplasmatota archaeon]